MSIGSSLLERPENRILVLCARGPTKHGEFAGIVGEVRDWEELVAKLNFHRLTLLFLHHLQGHEGLVPTDVLDELQRTGEQILHWNLFLLAELQEVTRALTTEGIRVLSYKGPSIAYSAYGSVALRRFIDLDVLISSREKKRVAATLRGAGYRAFAHQTALTPYLRRPKLGIEYETPFVSGDGQTLVDVHWSVMAPFESFPLGFEGMWERRVAVDSIAGVYTLCREDLILALCFHGLKHLWAEIEWIGCLLNLIQRGGEEGVKWDYVEGIAEKSGCQRILYLGLRLAMDLFEGEGEQSGQWENAVSPELQRKIEADAGVKQMAQQIWRRILPIHSGQGNKYVVFCADYILRFSLGVRGRKGWKLRGRFFVGLMRTGLFSLEYSAVALKIVKPWLKILSAAFGIKAKTRSS